MGTKTGFITKTQVSNLSKVMYDVGKLIVGGGIITPYIVNAEGENFPVGMFFIAGVFFIAGLLLDAAYDRMG